MGDEPVIKCLKARSPFIFLFVSGAKLEVRGGGQGKEFQQLEEGPLWSEQLVTGRGKFAATIPQRGEGYN